MSHLENEVRVVQERRSKLSDEIKAETAQAVGDRRKQLAAEEDAASQRMQARQKELDTLQGELVTCRREKNQLEGDVAGLTSQRDGLRASVDELAHAQQRAKQALDDLESRQLQAGSRVQYLQNEIKPLSEKIPILQVELDGLEQQKLMLQQNNATLSSQYETRKAKIEHDLNDLLVKQQQLELNQAGMLQQFDQVATDLAVRTKALDEREEILKRREVKATQSERMIARNASLLKL